MGELPTTDRLVETIARVRRTTLLILIDGLDTPREQQGSNPGPQQFVNQLVADDRLAHAHTIVPPARVPTANTTSS